MRMRVFKLADMIGLLAIGLLAAVATAEVDTGLYDPVVPPYKGSYGGGAKDCYKVVPRVLIPRHSINRN